MQWSKNQTIPQLGLAQNQYSAEYCTSIFACCPAHVFGGTPPAVFNRYTSLIVHPNELLLVNFSHATSVLGSGELLLLLFLHATEPQSWSVVLRLKNAVVESVK